MAAKQQQQQPPPPQELGVYYVAAVNYPNVPQPLTDEKALDLLLRTESNLPSTPFQWVRLDKPKHGHLAVFILPDGQPVPDDGFMWQDTDNGRRARIGEKELHVVSREQGFAAGDQFVTMTKRRYLVAGMRTSLQLVHYLLRDPNEPSRIAVLPHMAAAAAAAAKKKKLQQQQQQSSNAASDDPADRLLGDDLDAITTRDMATMRYKRNHAYLSDLFSHSTTADLTRNAKPLFDTANRAQLAEKFAGRKAALDAEMEAATAQHQATLKQFRDSSKLVFGHISGLSSCKTVEALNEAEQALATQLGLVVVPSVRCMQHEYAQATNSAVN